MRIPISILGIIVLLTTELSGKNFQNNQQYQTARSFGNFGPTVKKVYEVYKTTQEQVSHALIDPVPIAVKFFLQKANIPPSDVEVDSFHTSDNNGVTHVYLRQKLNGLRVVNGVGNVNVDKQGQILSFGNSFYSGVPSSDGIHPNISPEDAVSALAKLLNVDNEGTLTATLVNHADGTDEPPLFSITGARFAVGGIPVALKYIQVQEGSQVVLAWDLVVETKNNMYHTIVDASSGEVVQVIDWVSDASYNVFPLGINDPLSGNRSILVDPAKPQASPLGWHSQGEETNFTSTIGNNVYAQENIDGGNDYLENYRPDGSEDLKFDFPIDLTKGPKSHLNASITNLFYLVNTIHDLFYVYGFKEKSGNFQQNNFGLGGEGGDAVQANAQDGQGRDNANFLTPPDGGRGIMRMYVWTTRNPKRAGDLDGGLVMHEYLHGVSHRLTGGPNDVSCLGYGESGGMGEGWGDLFATITRVTVNSTRDDVYEMFAYSYGSGVRKFPYATKFEVNPSTYAFVVKPCYQGAHYKGEVWAVILYEVFWNLVEKHGFDPDWFNNDAKNLKTDKSYKSILNEQLLPRPNHKLQLGGNIVMMQILVDGMKLQPCNPNFIEARDAIIQADEIDFNGENYCEIWKGFAKRGLGTKAAYSGNESFDVPDKCL